VVAVWITLLVSICSTELKATGASTADRSTGLRSRASVTTMSEMKRTAVTKKDFRAFKAECERLIGVLGLGEWTAFYFHEVSKGSEDAHATCTINIDARQCIMRMRDWTDETFLPMDPKALARHEVGHLLVAKLSAMAHGRYITPHDLQMAEEEICNRLEKAS